MEKKSNTSKIIIIILAIIIALLLIYIVFYNNHLLKKDKIVSNKALKVSDYISIKSYDDTEELILKVENTSSQTFTNVTPYVIYYDSNNMPVHEGWGAAIYYFKPGSTRLIRFYDAYKDYSHVEIGLFNREDENNSNIVDLTDKINYEVKEEKIDDSGETALVFTGNNNYDKDLIVEFQIEYYLGNKLIDLDEFTEIINANSSIDTYEYLLTQYNDGTPYPEGYTYKVSLVEAVENVEYVESDLSESDNSSDIDIPEETTEDKIEHALFTLFKEQYGDKMDSAKIVVDKVYSSEEAKTTPGVSSLNLKEDEYAFEVTIDFLPTEGTDPNIFTIPNGEYNKDSGWVNNCTRVGVLRPNTEGSEEYKVTDFGTGW